LFDFSNTIVSGKIDDVKIRQRTIIEFLTLEGVAPEQIWERLQRVYQDEVLSSSQVEYWATETNADRSRRRTKLAMTALLRDTDVMADVLGFLPRKMIALQLTRVNRRFSTLCNCWCREEEGNGQQQRKRKWNQGSKSKKNELYGIF